MVFQSRYSTRRGARRHGPRWSLSEQWRFGRARTHDGIGILKIEGNDVLRLVVFKNCKVLRLEVFDRITALVSHGHVHQHQFGFGAKGVLSGLLLGENE